MSSDHSFMNHALRLASRARGRTRPNPMVGCVIVKEGRIVGKGYHHRAGEGHAEVLALDQARERAEGATVYVTLEPCSHYGRTPPCADTLIKAGVNRVVVAMKDPNPLVAGRGLERLRSAGIMVHLGVCEEEAHHLNQPFLTWITQKRPMLTLKMAASLDGKVATKHNESQWITGPEARLHVQKMRDRHDVVLVGSGTVLADNPRLNCRIKGGRDPIRLVVDSTLKIPLNANLFTSTTAPLWIATTEQADSEHSKKIESKGAEVIVCHTTKEGRVDLVDLMHHLGKRDILSVLSESGGILSHALLNAGLADRLALFLAPKFIGGREAPGMLNGLGIEHLNLAPRLNNLSITKVGEDILLEGAITAPCLPAS